MRVQISDGGLMHAQKATVPCKQAWQALKGTACMKVSCMR